MTALLPVPVEAVFLFLADLENHWRLADPFVEVLELDGPPGGHHGGLVLLCGPAGLRRRVRTRVVASAPPTEIVGTANVGRRTRGRVRWKLAPRDGGTQVTLSASLDTATALDRLLLAAGGWAWLRRRLLATLGRLADAVGSVPSREYARPARRVSSAGV